MQSLAGFSQNAEFWSHNSKINSWNQERFFSAGNVELLTATTFQIQIYTVLPKISLNCISKIRKNHETLTTSFLSEVSIPCVDQVFSHDMNSYSLGMKMYVMSFTCRSFSLISLQVFARDKKRWKSQSNVFRNMLYMQKHFFLLWQNLFLWNCFTRFSKTTALKF